MELIVFLGQVVIISLSGVMSPGPVTATTIALGSRNRYAGLLVALGHALVEIPLVVVITLGLGKVFKSRGVQMGIGLVGGVILLWMAWLMLKGLRKGVTEASPMTRDRPILAGIALSAASPYFLLWWATVGLKLAADAKSLGVLAFALFALVHSLCDVIWLTVLSWTSYHGSTVLSAHRQRQVLTVCAAAMGLFGAKFVWDAIWTTFR